jgi:hypothetical protein
MVDFVRKPSSFAVPQAKLSNSDYITYQTPTARDLLLYLAIELSKRKINRKKQKLKNSN